MEGKSTLQRLGLVPAAVALLTMAAWLAMEDSARGGSPNSVHIEPPNAVASPGGSVTVSLVAEPPEAGLGVWQMELTYDSALLATTACTPHPEGTCITDAAPDTVRSDGDTVDDLTETFIVFDLTFEAIGNAGECSPLQVQVLAYLDPDDIETNPVVEGGEICIQGTPVPTPQPTLAPPPCPRLAEFDPGNFSDSTNIDHELLPLIPGRQLILDGVGDGLPRRVIFTTTDVTKVINGVRTVVVWDRDFRDGVLKEEEIAFFAQDDAGNVWNLGEYPEEFLEGVFNGAPNTWIAGSAQAEGGIHMPGEPRLSEPAYLQGWAPEIDFLDCARVISTEESVCVPADCYDGVLVTSETSPLDPAGGSQQKYHASGVGIVQITAVEDPEGETLALSENPELSAEEMAVARERAVALDEHAYEISELYHDTEPAEVPPETPTATPEATSEPTATPAVPPCSPFAEYDPDNFSDPTTIDNELLPLIPGSQLVLDGVADELPRRVIFTTTDVTKAINGVRTVIVWKRDFRANVLSVEALGFFAQDDDGNVWNLGEYPEELENGLFVGAPHTWIAGSAGAEGGVNMPGDPALTDVPYVEGSAPEIGLLRCAEIIATDESACVPLDCFDGVLVTDETSSLDPAAGSQRMYHASGVGIFKIAAVDDPQGETLGLTSDPQLGAQEMADARARALALDLHAYDVSESYAETEPAEPPADDSTTPTPEPEPTEAAASPTPRPAAAGGSGSKPAPTFAPKPAPTRTPVPLPRRGPRTSTVRSARSLPNSGGAGSLAAGPVSIAWVLPVSVSLVLLGAYVYGSVRRSAVADTQRTSPPPESVDDSATTDLMFEHLETLKRERRESQLSDADDYCRNG